MTRRDFITKSSIAAALLMFSTQELAAKMEKFKISKDKIHAFEKLRIQLAYRPYNADLVNALLRFNERIDTSAYKDKEMKDLLIFLYANSRNKNLMEKLKNEIENPVIQSKKEIDKINKLRKEGRSLGNLRLLNQKKEMKKYKKTYFPDSYETLVYLRLSGKDKQEKEMKERIEGNDRLFNPGKEKEIYYKTLYYILIGDMSEAEYTVGTISKKIKQTVAKQKEEEKKHIEMSKRRHSRAKVNKKAKAFKVKNVFMAYIAGLGAFIYKDINKNKFKEFSTLAKELANEYSKNFYYYQMYANYIIYEDFDRAIEYLSYIEQNDPYEGIKEEMFTLYVNSANKNYKLKNYKIAWLSAKEGIIIGLTLNYKKYYKTVIALKRILKNAGLNYIKQLVRTNDRDLAQEILEETNRIMKLSK